MNSSNIKLRGSFALLAFLAGALSWTPAAAQQLEDRLNHLTLNQQQDLRATEWQRLPEKRENFEWGVWSSTSYFTFSNQFARTDIADPLDSALAFDQRVWGRWDHANGESAYVRVRQLDVRQDLAVGAVGQKIYEEGFDLDLAYYDLPSNDWKFRIGRQFLQLGRGVVLAQNLDGLRTGYESGQWSARAFWGRTPHKTTDLDLFVGLSKRDFSALEVSYRTLSDHHIFAYYLNQDDRNSIKSGAQPLNYESTYTAIGAEGPIARDFGYYLEGILERGDSPTSLSATGRSDIKANALLAEAIWRPDRRHHPTISLGHFRGSGDAERGSVLTNAASNPAGTDDQAFIGFGRFEAGLALSPRLSNLAVTRLSATWKPLEVLRDREELQLGASYFLYRKADAAGASSVLGANVADADLGSGFDLTVAWKPVQDLTLAIQGSRFNPGDAFPAATRTDATALFASATFSY